MTIKDPQNKHKTLSYFPGVAVIGFTSVYHEYDVLQSMCSTRVIVSPHQSLQISGKKGFLRRNAFSCAYSSGNVYLTPTFGAAYNLVSLGTLCDVRELHLSCWDRLMHQLVQIR